MIRPSYIAYPITSLELMGWSDDRIDWNLVPGATVIKDATLADGYRIEASASLWDKIRRALSELAEERCEGRGCYQYLPLGPGGHAHHVFGRGGGKRDDRIWRTGSNGAAERVLLWLCYRCHEHNHSPKAVPKR